MSQPPAPEWEEGQPTMLRLIEFIAQGLVDSPDAVQVEEGRSDRYFTAYHLTVAPEDIGKVIGRQGRVAKSIRNVLRAAAGRQGRHVALEVHEQSTEPTTDV